MIKMYSFIIEGKLVEVQAASKAEAYDKAKEIIFDLNRSINVQ